jgi:hypothetical protein
MIVWPPAEACVIGPVFATSIVHGQSPGGESFKETPAGIQQSIEVLDKALSPAACRC